MECDADILLLCTEHHLAVYNFSMKQHNSYSVTDQLWEEITGEMGSPDKEKKKNF